MRGEIDCGVHCSRFVSARMNIHLMIGHAPKPRNRKPEANAEMAASLRSVGFLTTSTSGDWPTNIINAIPVARRVLPIEYITLLADLRIRFPRGRYRFIATSQELSPWSKSLGSTYNLNQ